jgi:hypothetical protein
LCHFFINDFYLTGEKMLKTKYIILLLVLSIVVAATPLAARDEQYDEAVTGSSVENKAHGSVQSGGGMKKTFEGKDLQPVDPKIIDNAEDHKGKQNNETKAGPSAGNSVQSYSQFGGSSEKNFSVEVQPIESRIIDNGKEVSVNINEINSDKDVSFSKTQTESNWLAQSRLNIDEPGMVAARLLPGLHRVEIKTSSNIGNLTDLTLLGPDGHPRAFELFWRAQGETKRIRLEASSLQLLDDKRLLWEGVFPEKLILKRINLDISDKNYVGKVDILGLSPSGWKQLRMNTALYKTDVRGQVTFEINHDEYRSLRLYFTGYNKQFQETPAFVGGVEIEGEALDSGYTEDVIKPEIEQAGDGKTMEIRASLPGSGIRIDEITIVTEAQFQGTWRLGWETVSMGEQVFEEIRRGTSSVADNADTSLIIKIGKRSKGKTLVVKLDSQDYFGDVKDFTVKARVPYMVFFADQKGQYTARTGWGRMVPITETSTGFNAGTARTMDFSGPESNALWRPENMARDYNIKGGPFKAAGFKWKAAVSIDKPGFYRLALNDRAGLEENRQGLRLVKDNLQVPYFPGREEKRKIPVKPDIKYDKDHNRSVVSIALPYASACWTDLQLTGKGIFKRTVVVEWLQPGMAGWKALGSRDWISSENGKSTLSISLNGFPADQTVLRLNIDHGDNQPIELEDVQAAYQTRDLFFLAPEAGEYLIAGGNSSAKSASYDLSIVRDYLLNTEPVKIKMGEIEPFQYAQWDEKLNRVFSEQGWGLYAVLGFVTLILLIIIVRLFPHQERKE